jgi:hypothetical protein
MEMKRKLILIVSIAFLLRMTIFNLFIYDDAYIHYRYADKLLEGEIFVFNDVPTQGSTSPLWTVLMAVFKVIFFDYVLPSKIVGVLSSLGLVLMVFRIGKRATNSENVGLIAAFLLTVDFADIIWSNSGMEFSFYALMIALTIYFHMWRDKRLSGLFVGFCYLLRPEAAILTALLFFDILLKKDQKTMKFFVVGTLIVLPFILWQISTFGTIFTNTLYSKISGLESPLHVFIWLYKRYLLITVLAATGLIYVIKDKIKLLLPLAFFFTTALVYILFIKSGQMRYITHYWFIFMLLAAIGIEKISKMFSNKWVFPSLLLLLIPFQIISVVDAYSYSLFFYYENQMHFAAAEYIQNVVGYGASIAVQDDGILGHAMPDKYILDVYGLVTPEAIPYYQQMDFWGFIEESKPEYMVFAHDFDLFLNQEGLEQNCNLEATFEINLTQTLGVTNHNPLIWYTYPAYYGMDVFSCSFN